MCDCEISIRRGVVDGGVMTISKRELARGSIFHRKVLCKNGIKHTNSTTTALEKNEKKPETTLQCYTSGKKENKSVCPKPTRVTALDQNH